MRIMHVVEIMLSTSFWAVPAFIRVLPVTNSGPTTTTTGKSATCSTTGVADAVSIRSHAFIRARIGCSRTWRARIAHDAASSDTALLALTQATDHVGSATRRSDADHHVVGVAPVLGEVGPRLRKVVLGELDGLANGSIA